MFGKERKQSNMNEESRKFLDSLRDEVISVEEDDSTCTAKIYIFDTLVCALTYSDIDLMDDELRWYLYKRIVARAIISKWSKDAKMEER